MMLTVSQEVHFFSDGLTVEISSLSVLKAKKSTLKTESVSFPCGVAEICVCLGDKCNSALPESNTALFT